MSRLNLKNRTLNLFSLVLLIAPAGLAATDDGGVAEAKGASTRPARKLSPILMEAPELIAEGQPGEPRRQIPPLVSRVALSDADRLQSLNKAIAHGDVTSVEKALSHGADPNAPSMAPIPTMIMGFNGVRLDDLGDEIIQLSPIAPGAPALFRAVALPGPEAVAITQRLLDADAFVNGQATIAISSPDNPHQLSVLALALLNNINPAFLELIHLLRARGAEIDNNAQMMLHSALHGAITHSDLPTAYLQDLIDLGADLDADHGGESVIINAIEALQFKRRNDPKLIKWLLEHSSNPTALVNQRHPLYDQSALTLSNHINDPSIRNEVLRYLIDAGAVDNDYTSAHGGAAR